MIYLVEAMEKAENREHDDFGMDSGQGPIVMAICTLDLGEGLVELGPSHMCVVLGPVILYAKVRSHIRLS